MLKKDILCIAIVAIIVSIGAQLGTIVTPVLLIVAIAILLLLAAFGKVNSVHYPYIIFGATLGLMYSASMVGAHVIGSDMQQEYYVSTQVGPFGWHPAAEYGTQSSTSFVIGWLVPFISWFFHIPIVWVYKAVLPFIFSFTPVFLYYAFKTQISARQSFFSCLFFLIVPVATLEIVQIGKAMVAETFFAAVIYLMVSNIKQKYKVPLILFCLTIATLSHYTVGFIAISYLGIILIVRLITFKWNRWIFGNSKLAIWGIVAILSISGCLSYLYYEKANGGVIVDVVSRIVPGYTRIAADTVKSISSDSNSDTGDTSIPDAPAISDTNQVYGSKLGYLEEQPELVKTAIGMDFYESSTVGQVFRLLQYLTQLMIIIGAIYLLFTWKKYKFTTEFVAGIGASFFLLLACIFVPHFSSIINVTRFYHLSLFFIAPLFVLGGICLFRNYKIVAVVAVIYFIFTSGLVFEAIKSNTTDRIDVPYAVALSAERTGVVGVYTDDDINAAKWIVENGNPKYRVVSDYNGYRLMMSFVRINPQLRNKDDQYPPMLDSIPKEASYIFVTSWDTEHKSFIKDVRNKWEASGTRDRFDLPTFDYPIVFQSGGAIVYEKFGSL